MGLVEDKIVTSQDNEFDTVKGLLSQMIEEDSEIITMIVGEDANETVTAEIETWVEETYPDIELDQHDGQQPVYQYLFSVMIAEIVIDLNAMIFR